MPTPTHLNKIGPVRKSDTMKDIKKLLEKANQDLIAARNANDVARVKKLQQTIANLTGTIERNN